MTPTKMMVELSKRLGPKLCKDCKFVKPTAWWELPFIFRRYEFAHCVHPIAGFFEWDKNDWLVDGKPRGFTLPCEISRMENRCGAEGKYWESKTGTP